MALINVADNTLAAAYRYDAWGNVHNVVGEMAADNNYLFTGREYDWQTGVYYYRARSYDASLGRFMQQDPAGMVDGPNLYAYCGNDPVNRRDPSGARYLRIVISDRGTRRSLLSFDDMVACMAERYPYATPGSIATIIAVCWYTIGRHSGLVGFAACAAASYPVDIAEDLIDCAYENWGKTTFYWYFFYLFMTDTGYTGFYPV